MEWRRPSSGTLRRVDGNSLIGGITRDEVFHMLEEKVDKKDLERQISALATRYAVHDRVIKYIDRSKCTKGVGTGHTYDHVLVSQFTLPRELAVQAVYCLAARKCNTVKLS